MTTARLRSVLFSPGLPSLAVAAIAGLALTPRSNMLAADPSVFLLAGRVVRAGGLPYRDLWIGKPPFLVILEAVFGGLGGLLGVGDAMGVRILSVLAAMAAAAAVSQIARAYGLRWLTAVIAGGAVGAILLCPAFSEGGGLSEPPAFALAMLAWALVAGGRRGAGRLLLSGALLALGVATSLLVAGLALPILLEASGVRRSVGQPWRRLTLLALGGALPLAAIVTWLGAGGALGDMWDQVIVYSRAYGGVHCPVPGLTNWPCYPNFDQRLVIAGWALLGGAIVSAFGLIARPFRRWPWAAIAGLIGLAIVSVPQLRRSPADHYLWPILVGAVLPAATAIESALASVLSVERRRRLIGILSTAIGIMGVSLVLVLSTLLGSPSPKAAIRSGEYRDLVTIIDSSAPAEAPLFVWGYAPSIYALSDRAHTGRYIDMFAMALPGYTNAARIDELCTDLARERPVILVIGHDVPSIYPGDPLPQMDGSSRFVPIRAMIARAWREVSLADDAVVLVPVADLPTSVADCAP